VTAEPSTTVVTCADRRATLLEACLADGHAFAVVPVTVGPRVAGLDQREPAFVICTRCGRNWDLSPATHARHPEGAAR
jgi:hypothetical protein